MQKKILTLLYFIELYWKKDKFPVRKGSGAAELGS